MFRIDSQPGQTFPTFEAAAGALLASGSADGCRVEVSSTDEVRARFFDRAGVQVDAVRYEAPPPHEGIAGLEVPNMDALDADDLEELSAVFQTLANYARGAARARVARAAGRIRDAEVDERACDYAYKALPEWARW